MTSSNTNLDSTKQKIQRLSLLLYAYAAIQAITFLFVWLKNPEVTFSLFAVFGILISIFLAYVLPRRQGKVLYWVAITHVGLYLLRGLVAFALVLFLFLTENPAEVITSLSSMTWFIYLVGLILASLAGISFIYLLKKDIREYITGVSTK